MEGELDLPFKVEYAKSSRASCKGCKGGIGKEELRLAAMIQSPKFDGKIPNWYHFTCFFAKQKVKTTGDIHGFNSIRWEDQKKIKDKIGGGESSGGTTGTSSATKKSDFKDFSTEYAKSNRSTCRGCDEKINKGAVRISKLDYEGERSRMYGPQSMWYHVDCFAKRREELEFFGGGEELPGFMSLGAAEQKELKSKLPKIAKKRKASAASDEPSAKKKIEESKEEKKLKAQSDLLFSFHDKLKSLTKRECQDLLEYNGQEVPSGESRILNLLADCMAFGALKKCKECGGQLKFSNDTYHCTGDISAWSKCQFSSQNPERNPFKVPEELKDEYPFLKTYKYKKHDRVYPKHPEGPSRPILTHGVLQNLRIIIIGKLTMPKEDIGKLVETYKGKLTSKFEDKVVCVISTEDEVKSMSKKMTQAKENDIPVVSEKFLEELPNMKSPRDVAAKINELSICDWGCDQTEKIEKLCLKEDTTVKSKEESRYTKNFPDKVKLTVKGGAAVDPDSGLQDTHQVFTEKGSIYNAVLGSVDVQKGRNSYYKLQLLKSDKSHEYRLFRSWGRLGTTIGGNKTESFPTKLEAIMEFKRIYEEKTGNQWEDRENFVKYPNKFYPVEVDYGDNEANSSLKSLKTGKSKLPKAVQDLICLIFDVETMKQAMLEFEIDLKKMPLGRLTRKQIEKAYCVLTEVQELLKKDGTPAKFLDASNRFYTLIPHDFGMKKPLLLDNEQIIQSKREMLDSLLEIEVAYNLLNADYGSDVDPIDHHYEQLKAHIEVLEKDHEEFKTIENYVKNTHAETHKQYDLVIEEVFKVSRHEEHKRYKPFKKLHNRKLLWHGSRLTNFAGILSHGLKIAPPEAPVTGYMFGKGIYFADMVSKSANYCQTSKTNPKGLLLLCEVALGNMYERTEADFITKLPPDHHSTKGIGKTSPDPSKNIVTPDGVEIPLGPPVKEEKKSSLLYNEYIVYDIAQVNIRYLLKVNFKWKY